MLFQGRELADSRPEFIWRRQENVAKLPEEFRNRKQTLSKPQRYPSPRSIRFADSEWNLVEQVAARHGIAAGQLVREGVIALAEGRLGESPPATLAPGHLALIEEMYRYVYVMATLNRERLLESGGGDDVNAPIDAARKTMSQTMKEGPA